MNKDTTEINIDIIEPKNNINNNVCENCEDIEFCSKEYYCLKDCT